MRTRAVTFAVIGAGIAPALLAAQAVDIPKGDPVAVVAVLKTQLASQGFVLDHASKKEALFSLDRGNVVQNNGMVVHVHLEMHTWFKSKNDTLKVTAIEEAVGQASQGADFRRAIDSPTDVAKLQDLLNYVKTRVVTPDSAAAKRDTTH